MSVRGHGHGIHVWVMWTLHWGERGMAVAGGVGVVDCWSDDGAMLKVRCALFFGYKNRG